MHRSTSDVRKFEDALKRSFPDLDGTGRQALTVPEEVLCVVARRSLERFNDKLRERYPDWCSGLLRVEKQLVPGQTCPLENCSVRDPQAGVPQEQDHCAQALAIAVFEPAFCGESVRNL